MMVTARPINNPLTIANALPCNQNVGVNGYLSRPLAGSINFNPGSNDFLSLVNSPSNNFLFRQLVYVGLHESTHALGFTNDLYSSYLTPNGALYLNGATTSTSYAGYPTTTMTTPRVTNWAQNYFNCSSLTGLELESAGAQGTANSHWESRLVVAEYMTGVTLSLNPVFSGLTLSLFEDMGWYSVDYTVAQPMRFGLGMGCGFVTQSCSSSTWGNDFCTDSPSSYGGNNYCTGERDAVGYCSFTAYTSALPSGYQYISGQPMWGGNQYQDFCPTPLGYSNRYCKDEYTSFTGAGIPQVGTTLGPSSMCLTISWPQDSTLQGSCYLVFCTQGAQTYLINVGGANYSCTPGSTVTVSSLGGLVVRCPALAVACPTGNFSKYDVNSWNPSFNQPISNAPPNAFTPFSLPDNPFQNSSFSGFSLPSFTGFNFRNFGSGNSSGFAAFENNILALGSPLFIALIVIGAVCCCGILFAALCGARR